MGKATIRLTIIKAWTGIMEAKLNHWGAKLEVLAAQADTAERASPSDFPKHIDALISKHQTLRTKFDKLRAAGSEGVESLRSSLDASWNDLEEAIKIMTVRFREALPAK